ncbi:hypothetical protein EDF60_1593 [Leucobacter luti]|uniref:hypothetical protein n=1 Tax=Leucobacter luti TaxID=340320 RepID=UPI0010498882|nr:hypothetical protein [Leucobacter luti]MCW2286947.1 hypothetical protein [Leucobacter luti]TCK41174.1 hypothetical protein EDF60_1593 [Leucobacter luti]
MVQKPTPISSVRSRADNWTLRQLSEEALANVLSPYSRSRWFTYFVVFLGMVFVATRGVEWESLQLQLSELGAQGRNVVLVESAIDGAPATIDRLSCEALTTVLGVERAGGVSDATSQDFVQFGKSVQVYSSSTTLFPLLSRANILLGRSLLDLPPGEGSVLLGDGWSATALVSDMQPDGIPTNTAVLGAFSVEEEQLTACLVVLDPYQRAEEAMPQLLSQLKVRNHPVAASPAIRDLVNPVDQYLARFSRSFPIGIGLILGSVMALSIRSRSSEIATYRLSGTGRSSASVLLFFEALCLTGLFWLSGSGAALLILGFNLALLTILSELLVVAGVAVFISNGAAYLVLRRSPIALAKDR